MAIVIFIMVKEKKVKKISNFGRLSKLEDSVALRKSFVSWKNSGNFLIPMWKIKEYDNLPV